MPVRRRRVKVKSHTRAKPKTRALYKNKTQSYNPVTRTYVLRNTTTGKFMSNKKTPYKNIRKTRAKPKATSVLSRAKKPTTRKTAVRKVTKPKQKTTTTVTTITKTTRTVVS